MRRSEVRTTWQAAREWEARGMLRPGAYDTIRQELAPLLAGTSLATQAMYAIGGLMLGAATAALYGLLQLNKVLPAHEEAAWVYFLSSAILVLLAAIVAHGVRQTDLGDALLIAALVPTAITIGPRPYHDALWLMPVAIGVALVVWRRDARLVPALSMGVAITALVMFFYRSWDSDPATAAWIVLALGTFAGVAAWTRLAPPPWMMEAQGLATVSLLGAWLMTVMELLEPRFDAGVEVLFALGIAPVLLAGIVLEQRTVVVLATAALTVDAVVFAFDVGGPATGLVVLLLIAGLLIGTATVTARRRRGGGRGKRPATRTAPARPPPVGDDSRHAGNAGRDRRPPDEP